MRGIIIFGCALLAGCATPPEVVEQDDVIPINAAPAPSELKVEHHRFKNDVIPGAYVDRSGYTPTIMISDPAKRSIETEDINRGLGGSIKSDQPNGMARAGNVQTESDRIAAGNSSNERGAPRICPAVDKDCVLAELFFGLDQDKLTNVGAAIIKSMDVAGKSLELIGYADAVGEKDYNGRLALARANNVRDALIAEGAKEVVIRAGHEARFSGPRFRKVIIVGL